MKFRSILLILYSFFSHISSGNQTFNCIDPDKVGEYVKKAVGSKNLVILGGSRAHFAQEEMEQILIDDPEGFLVSVTPKKHKILVTSIKPHKPKPELIRSNICAGNFVLLNNPKARLRFFGDPKLSFLADKLFNSESITSLFPQCYCDFVLRTKDKSPEASFLKKLLYYAKEKPFFARIAKTKCLEVIAQHNTRELQNELRDIQSILDDYDRPKRPFSTRPIPCSWHGTKPMKRKSYRNRKPRKK